MAPTRTTSGGINANEARPALTNSATFHQRPQLDSFGVAYNGVLVI